MDTYQKLIFLISIGKLAIVVGSFSFSPRILCEGAVGEEV